MPQTHSLTLTGPTGLRLRVLALGGIVAALEVPDGAGGHVDVTVGVPDTEAARADTHYRGALVGRVANRIRLGQAPLDGRTLALTANHGPHHLHGGAIGLHRRAWTLAPFTAPHETGVTLSATVPDGEDGYPGTLVVRVTYALDDAGAFTVTWQAESDAPTPWAPTQHVYWNLAGRGEITGHTLQVDADAVLAIDAAQLPTGARVPVDGTPFDVRRAAPIGPRLGDPALAATHGLDHTFVLRDGARHAARLADPATGRTLTITTSEPALHAYTGNHLAGAPAAGGGVLPAHAGIALETGGFPDAPNHPGFPPIVLRPGAPARSWTRFALGVAGQEKA
ncbi:MAG: aldose epimerase family protein [Gemmatimonadales bacterium]|nr:aldose epimerase family protein [Gemmatimonadales bacterium]